MFAQKIFKHSTINFKNLNSKQIFKFAAYDPYYLLGVDRGQDFKEIKKIYFKLAGEYHPDKNKSPEAAKQFIMIKEAFEQIKQQRGKSVKMDFEKSQNKNKTQYKSVRPNADDYSDDFRDENQEMNQDNFKEYAHRAPEQDQYNDIRDSLNTMHDINDIKIRVDDVVLPNPSDRFGLEEKTTKIKNFSDGSYLFLAFVGILFGAGFYFINQTHNKIVTDRYQNLVVNMLNRKEFEEAVEDDKDILQDVAVDLSKKREYNEFVSKIEKDKKINKQIASRQVPIIKDFVSASQIVDDEDDD